MIMVEAEKKMGANAEKADERADGAEEKVVLQEAREEA